MPHFIVESPVFQEADVRKSEPGKAIFRMTMQTVDEVNQNKRMYPRDALAEAMEECKPRMKKRAFLGELDHPIPTGNQFDEVRQTTVMLKEVSHLLRDYEIRGNHVIGELETTSTGNGAKLMGLLKDKCGIGLSMRGMAELNQREDGVNVVKKPLMVITYDSVSVPSHAAATVDFNNLKFESLNVLTESLNSGTICTPDGRCFLANYFDKLVETRVIEFFHKWV